MGIKDLQNFIEKDPVLLRVGLAHVDLVKTAWKLNKAKGQHIPSLAPNRLALVVDGEGCLDRLYGGYYSDWCCGGEWNHMLEFLSVLFTTMQQANVHTAIFFNGALEPDRFEDWVAGQLRVKQNVRSVLKHLHKRGTPPPKVWWVPPTAIRSVLRLALRHLNVPVMLSMESHNQEVIGFLRENGYHGIMADNPEFCIFDPPRYFSAHSIKLTLKLTVETRELIMDEVAKSLDLNPNRFSLMAALLGNHVLTESDLAAFHARLTPKLESKSGQARTDAVIRSVVNYVRSLQTVDDVPALGTDIFGAENDPRVKKLKDVVEYYNTGTEDGYKKFVPSKKKKKEGIKLASDTAEAEGESRQHYKNITAGKKKAKVIAESIEANPEADSAAEQLGNLSISGPSAASDSQEAATAVASGDVKPSEQGKYPVGRNEAGGSATAGARGSGLKGALKPVIPSVHTEVVKTAADRHRQATMAPTLYNLLTTGDVKLPALLEDETPQSDMPLIHNIFRELRQKMYGILFNYHHVTFTRHKHEDEVNALKKKIKAVKIQLKKVEGDGEKEGLEAKLAETNKRLEELDRAAPDKPDIKVREWVPYNNYTAPELVQPKSCQWSVPTVKRLWFGTTVDDKQRRFRAFLSCMNSDTPLMQNTSYVPQHLLLMSCVLRYIMTQNSILRKPELDAFLVTACSPDLLDSDSLASMKLDLVTPRGVQLATLFMQGVDMALLANDACGAPVPFLMCCPWLFFDGKLFHSKLRRAVVAQNLMEMCNHDLQMVMKVEQMRQAILEGLMPEFANLGPMGVSGGVANQNVGGSSSMGGGGRGPAHLNNTGGIMMGNNTGGLAGLGMRQGGGRGGQLVVAGSVVGQWAGNSNNSGRGGGMVNDMYHNHQHQQQQQQYHHHHQQQQQHGGGGMGAFNGGGYGNRMSAGGGGMMAAHGGGVGGLPRRAGPQMGGGGGGGGMMMGGGGGGGGRGNLGLMVNGGNRRRN